MLEKELKYYIRNKREYKSQSIDEKRIKINKRSFLRLGLKIDDTLMTEEEFFNMIEESKQQIKEGNFITIKPEQSVSEILDKLCIC